MRRPPPRRLAALAAALLLAACSGEDGTSITPPPGGDDDVRLDVETVVTGLTTPTYLTAPPGDDRLFVLEQPGRVRVVRDGQLLQAPYLDISGSVASVGEQGLLGMAFHPDFPATPVFYLDFTIDGSGDTRVVRYSVSDPSSDRATVTGSDTLLRVPQFETNHNGGMLAFGPDGNLYVSLGDGGGAGDPGEHGQDSTSVLGSIVRLTADGSVPPDNPFVGVAGNDSIWAYGLRNPWRFAFDPPSGRLFIADVGQRDWEEVNAVQTGQAGLNYGWSVLEGTHCFEASACDRSGFQMPVIEYSHFDGCSVTGGFVYRGSDVPEATGRYFFADLCSSFVRSFRMDGGEATDVIEHDLGGLGSITSFGTDAQGELYVLEGGGRVLRIVPEG
jgi:glucose/arabinose dehydrogenase